MVGLEEEEKKIETSRITGIIDKENTTGKFPQIEDNFWNLYEYDLINFW